MDKNKYSEWGKLGGRPKLDNKKNKVISFRLTLSEFDKIKEKAGKKNLRVTDYCKFIISEKELPNFEQNKTLLKYAQNFTRISNYMKMGIFNEEEKNRLLKEIEEVIIQLKSKVEW